MKRSRSLSFGEFEMPANPDELPPGVGGPRNRPKQGPSRRRRKKVDGRPRIDRKDGVRKPRASFNDTQRREIASEWRAKKQKGMSKRAYLKAKCISSETLTRCLSVSFKPEARTQRERRAKNPRGGRNKEIMHVKCERVRGSDCTVADTLQRYVVSARGRNPKLEKNIVRDQFDEARELEDGNGARLFITYHDLIDCVQETHPIYFYSSIGEGKEDNINDIWYHRVRRWARDEAKLSVRKANAASLTKKQTKKVATGVNRLLCQIREDVATHSLKPEEIANLDETACRILADEIGRTLHWTGASEVLKAQHSDSKLCLSIVVVWFADGTMDFVVVYKTQKQNLDGVDRWQEIDGVMWFESHSKWSNTEHYHQVLRYFFSLKKRVKLFVADSARGHNGPAATYFLDSMGHTCVRRIPGSSTWAAQAADQSGCNGVLKKLIRNLMRKYKLRILCNQARDKNAELPSSLTRALKEVASRILCEAREKMSSDQVSGKNGKSNKEQVKQAFCKTLLCKVPGNAPTKLLAKLLEHTDDAAPVVGELAFCCKLCGHAWATKCKEFKKHGDVFYCHMQRDRPFPPLLQLPADLKERARLLNQKWIPNLVAQTEGREIVMGPNGAWLDLVHCQPVEEGWWNRARDLTYREASERERFG